MDIIMATREAMASVLGCDVKLIGVKKGTLAPEYIITLHALVDAKNGQLTMTEIDERLGQLGLMRIGTLDLCLHYVAESH